MEVLSLPAAGLELCLAPGTVIPLLWRWILLKTIPGLLGCREELATPTFRIWRGEIFHNHSCSFREFCPGV